MTPVKTDTGWRVDFRLGGRGSRRIRKTFATKSEALAFLNFAMAKRTDPAFASPQDNRRLSELIDLWYQAHGSALRDGRRRKDWLHRLSALCGNPVARNFGPQTYTALRVVRSESVTANTLNRDLAYLRALFSTLYKLGLIAYPSPLARVSQLPHRPTELAYLTSEQISLLLAELRDRSPDCHAIASICLSTGARWSEAQTLTPAAVEPTRLRYYGKNGRFRYLPISDDLYRLITGFCHGKKPNEGIFRPSYETLRHALDRVGIDLPRGQLSHVFRHTFATTFLTRGGDLRTLQRVLDHGDIRMTLRYAHAVPDHLSQVLTCNPLA